MWKSIKPGLEPGAREYFLACIINLDDMVLRVRVKMPARVLAGMGDGGTELPISLYYSLFIFLHY